MKMKWTWVEAENHRDIDGKIFGDELSDAHDTKIISIWNDKDEDPNAAKMAHRNYLDKQDEDVLNKISTSLHISLNLSRNPHGQI